MFKKALIALVIFAAILIAGIFIYRYQILQYSAETIIRKALPDYVRIEKIIFDAKDSRIVLKNFKILNPPDFSLQNLLEVEDITCSYKGRGKSLLDGFEILEPSFKKAVLSIERIGDGRVNLQEMGAFVESKSAAKAASGESKDKSVGSGATGSVDTSRLLKLPQTFALNDCKLIFIDRLQRKPHMITLENINAALSVKMDDSYSKVLWVDSTGKGVLNGNQDEKVSWVISFNPTTPRLTMSNNFVVAGLDIVSFEPYYDKYSPFVFKRGRFSGNLIFDFDNGNIGSTNEVHLSDFQFYIKRGYENAQFLEAGVADFAKYFSSPSGDIVFDFKLKGDMSNPKPYPGPITKRALASMVMDKAADVLGKISSGQGSTPGAPKSDIEKAKEYIDLFQNMIKKK